MKHTYHLSKNTVYVGLTLSTILTTIPILFTDTNQYNYILFSMIVGASLLFILTWKNSITFDVGNDRIIIKEKYFFITSIDLSFPLSSLIRFEAKYHSKHDGLYAIHKKKLNGRKLQSIEKSILIKGKPIEAGQIKQKPCYLKYAESYNTYLSHFISSMQPNKAIPLGRQVK